MKKMLILEHEAHIPRRCRVMLEVPASWRGHPHVLPPTPIMGDAIVGTGKDPAEAIDHLYRQLGEAALVELWWGRADGTEGGS